MSKYIIDTGDYLFTTDGVLVVGFDCDNKPDTFYNSLDNLEELNSDYINEHYGELQDEAYEQGYADAERIWRAPSSDNEFYQKGLEDGKKSTEKGCEGCKYDGQKEGASPCCECARVCDDHYIPKRSDRIEVGDEVKHHFQGYGVVTRIKEVNGKTHYNAVWSNGNTGYYESDDLTKTGKHYDIASILEAMRK